VPERRIRIVADANYANASILKKLPKHVDFIGRAPMDAAVYAQPRRQRMGRPRVKGSRLPSPKQRGRSAEGWRRVNRTERAVERTAPMALWVYTLIVAWYLTTGKKLKTSRLPQFPWYRKEVPAFSDMLAALRRETWGRRLLDPAGFDRSDQKSVGPLLDAIGYAA
jgi:hypothetical protein